MMVVHMGAREARNNFSDLLGKVHYGGRTLSSSNDPASRSLR